MRAVNQNRRAAQHTIASFSKGSFSVESTYNVEKRPSSRRRQLCDGWVLRLGSRPRCADLAALGAGVWSSAFILAFTLSKLVSPLVWRGCVDVCSGAGKPGVLEKEGRSAAFEFFGQIFLRVAAGLVGVVVCGWGLLWCLVHFGHPRSHGPSGRSSRGFCRRI